MLDVSETDLHFFFFMAISGLSGGEIAGIVIGCLIGIILVLTLIGVYWKKRQSSGHNAESIAYSKS